MSPLQLHDLKAVRAALNKSQTELAALLGISVRAVQSYEQGWRDTPPHVQKLAGLLLFLDWRKQGNRKSKPCWEVNGCPESARAKCPAAVLECPDMCWIVTGNGCHGKELKTWDEKLARCRKCAVMSKWLA